MVYFEPGMWCILAYYTLCPESPDGSGNVLLAAGDLDKGRGHVALMDKDGHLLDRFGDVPLSSAFYHTGLWQSFSADGKYVYYQSGADSAPAVTRRELETGREIRLEHIDLEGAPAAGAQPISGLMGMLYAAGYADGHFHPELSPVPFGERSRHGLFALDFDNRTTRLLLSVQQVLDADEDPELRQWDKEQRERTGDGLTLMLSSVRWSPDGSRMLFYFGNHCVDKARGEPHVTKVYTADADLTHMKPILNMSQGRGRGLHWSWQPDNRHLIGYATVNGQFGLCEADGVNGGVRIISSHNTGGHPSIHPFQPHLAVTDTYGTPGMVSLIDLRDDSRPFQWQNCHTFGPQSAGRNPNRVCNHPVFSQDGKTLFFNVMDGPLARVERVPVPEGVL